MHVQYDILLSLWFLSKSHWFGYMGEIKTPPFTASARLEAGFLLRKLQKGELLGLPHSRPMPSIGLRCHELRINDSQGTWRIIYRIDEDAIVILKEVFQKKTNQTPEKKVIETSSATHQAL